MITSLYQRAALLTVGALLTFTTLSAYDECTPCCYTGDHECYGGWDIGLDFLYWKPCVDNLDYAATLNTVNGTSVVDTQGICLNWQPGLRVLVNKRDFFCNWDLAGSFVYLKADGKDSVATPTGDSPNILSTLIPASLSGSSALDQASGEYSALFYRWDLVLAYQLECSNPCLEIVPFVGFAGITLNQELKSTFGLNNAVTGQVESGYSIWNSKLFGIGLKVGSDVVYTVTKGLELFAKGAGELITAKQFNSKHLFEITESATTSNYSFNQPECCMIIPGYHIQLGVHAVSALCGPEMGIRFGYEFIRYFNIPTAKRFMGDQFATQAALSTSNSVTTFGTHGLFVGAELSF